MMQEAIEDRALVRNTADPSQVKEAERRQKYGRTRELEDMRWMLSQRPGRRYLWQLLGTCGVFRTSNSETANETFFNEGRRDIGLRLLADINEADPQAYVTMMTESRRENG